MGVGTEAARQAFALSVSCVAMQLFWATAAEAATLRGAMATVDAMEGGGRLLEEDEPQPWWFFLIMPFLSGIVGWGTNKVALKMTFYPYKFWGIELVRFKDQPAGLFGWQGIVPTKAEKMASNSVDLMTQKLFNVKEIFTRIDKDKAAVHLRAGFEETLDRMIDKLSHEYIIENTTAWKRTEKVVKEQIKTWALDELPSFTSGFMGDLIENLDDVYDLKHMSVQEMVDHPELLVSVFTSVGAKELLFIEHSGFYFGFIFGCIQTVLFRWAIPAPWGDYMLPLLGAFVGYLTNLIALKMIFNPINPIKICGGRFTLQGLFLKRQKEASAKFASKMVATVLRSEKIWWYMVNGPRGKNFEALLRKHAESFTERMVGFSKPLVLSYIGPDNFEKMKADTGDLAIGEINGIIEFLHDYTDQALDLETEIREKMGALPSNEFERVLHPVFEEDEAKLIAVGAFLGAIVGFGQMMLSFALVGEFFPPV